MMRNIPNTNKPGECVCPGNLVLDSNDSDKCICPGDMITDNSNPSQCICPPNQVPADSNPTQCLCTNGQLPNMTRQCGKYHWLNINLNKSTFLIKTLYLSLELWDMNLKGDLHDTLVFGCCELNHVIFVKLRKNLLSCTTTDFMDYHPLVA